MIAYVTVDIESMPRGGPHASWLDRRLETDRPEYIDRDDVDAKKRAAIRSLDRVGRVFGLHKTIARIVLDEVADVPEPRILELGSGHGGLARALLDMHATAHVTVSDVDTSLVAAIGAGALGSHPRALVRRLDATAIDCPDGAYDLAVFALSFHHLPPALASRVFSEGTRVADKLVIIDLPRPPSMLHLLRLAHMLPLAMFPMPHDGIISSLRAYSRSALLALAEHADPRIEVELRGGRVFNKSLRPLPQIVVASLRGAR
ncbi:class I SAM-dependent methyltransferase [Mycobacterium asiaticum]|uniref:Methyltransferase type 11 n=1 Tax=Mycobacterium asiaticum TaxID=1790 RepID=A0A1A3N102_MYCAS|nr:class I SAM-dependent methyltransferase [Mycobacterium asiaticum]OBK15466.1 methyltransferase type 11 [Mycobacterium asiaticum]OBK98572.1 methyltransferase type 11 [Mycobacterium asiaticum]